MLLRAAIAATVAVLLLAVAAHSRDGADRVKPRVQTGTVTIVSGGGPGNPVNGFGFRPDGAAPTGAHSDTGPRSLAWGTSIDWARCAADGSSCHWYSGVEIDCLEPGRRIELASVYTEPVDGAGSPELVAWLKCLGRR